MKKRRKHKQKEQFFYKTPETNYVILVIESLDRDTQIRRLGPVAIRVTVDGDSYLEILNEPEDHYYCSGYPCGKRLSTYFAPIPDIPGTPITITHLCIFCNFQRKHCDIYTPANCVCGRVYWFHVVRPSERTNERTKVCP